jgi:hypothetical protein
MVDLTYQMVLSTLQTAGILVGIFYYIMSLRNQNKARKTQLYWQINEKTSQENIISGRSEYMAQEWETPKEFITYFQSTEGRKVIGATLGYYEGMGVMVKEGLLDIRVVALYSSGIIRKLWEQFIPIKDEVRRQLQWPRLCIEVEYLYNELLKFHKEHPEVPM